ncbi:MAG: transglycosylase SLT domain-containing protein, partial [Elusimicrobiota bacterium]
MLKNKLARSLQIGIILSIRLASGIAGAIKDIPKFRTNTYNHLTFVNMPYNNLSRYIGNLSRLSLLLFIFYTFLPCNDSRAAYGIFYRIKDWKNIVNSKSKIMKKKSITVTKDTKKQSRIFDISTGSSRKDRFDSIILEIAYKYDLDPFLLKALIAVESNFNPAAVGPSPRR